MDKTKEKIKRRLIDPRKLINDELTPTPVLELAQQLLEKENECIQLDEQIRKLLRNTRDADKITSSVAKLVEKIDKATLLKILEQMP